MLEEKSSGHPPHRLTFGFFWKVIDGTGAVDPRQCADGHVLGPSGLQIRQRAKGYDLPIRAPERSRQIEERRMLRSMLDCLEQEMTEKEAEIHGGVAEMSRFIIHEGKAPLVRENVLGTE